MKDEVQLGSVAGFPVAANWSVLVIVWLLTWGLAEGVLPDVAAGYSPGMYWFAALIGAACFFASLFAHEFAHALVARRHGVKVEGLTLWMFGGIAKLGGEVPTPGAELRIAVVGPAVSIAIGFGAGALAALLAVTGFPDLVVAVPAWLAGINLLLAVFNLIPGAPLDGGRILRALLWRRSGDQVRSSVTAAKAGRTVGFGLITLGLLEFLVGANVGGLWTAFIGWFLQSAARMEGEHALAEDVLGGLRVSDAMSSNPQAAPGIISVHQFVQEFVLATDYSAFPVTDPGGMVVGLVSLAQARALPTQLWMSTALIDIMVPLKHVPMAAPGDSLVELLAKWSPAVGSRALVFEDDRLVGILSSTDVARAVERAIISKADDEAIGWAQKEPRLSDGSLVKS